MTLPDGIVTLREVYGLVNQTRTELMSEVKLLRSDMEKRLDTLEADIDKRMIKHDTDHNVEDTRRRSMTRWAVTTVLSGMGVITAIIVAIFGR